MHTETLKKYARFGINPRKAMKVLATIPVSLQCWQLDDVTGFEHSGALSGGIQATGNYPGKARNFLEMTSDMEEAIKHIPGKKKVNLHAIYRVSDNPVDRSQIQPEHFRPWVDFARTHGLGLDFNPTVFSSPYFKDNLSLSSPDKAIRDYWIRHCINSRKVAEYFGKELKQKALCNLWIPDGLKDTPADRLGPRQRLKDSLDQIFAVKVDRRYIDDSVESKVFGIGLESYTVGSNEFYLSYALKNHLLCLLDTGHFHPTENVADKISSLLLYSPKIALHVSRPVRWDSDHVIRLDDDLQAIADEIVQCHALKKTYIGLDYFDASINRIASLVIGARNMQKALLKSLLTPWELLGSLQDKGQFTEVLAIQEELKTLPFDDVWDAYCHQENVISDLGWLEDVQRYEKENLQKRGL